MDLQRIVDFNKEHALTTLNTRLYNLAALFNILAAFAAAFHLDIKVPYLSVGDRGIDAVISQVTMLTLLFNTEQVYKVYVRKVQITDLCRYSGSLVYVLHFAGSIASFLHPTQWLFWVVGIIASIGVVNFQLYRIAARIPGYPLLPLFRRWARNVPFYASIVLIYACVTVLVSRPEFYIWLDDLPRDPRTLALLQLFTAHIRTIMYSGAGLALSIPMIKDVSFGPLHSEQFEQTTRDALEVFYKDLT